MPVLLGPGDAEGKLRPQLYRTRSNSSKISATSNHTETKKNTILKSHGRPPWYDENGSQLSDAFVIGVAGGSASGKTYVAQEIVRSLGSIPSVVILSQDSFYKEHTPEELELAFANQYDFDHPDAIDMPMFAACLADLKRGRQTNIPVYSFTEHQRMKEKKYLYGAAVIITEGIMALHDPSLRKLYDLKIFVQCDSDLMLARRLRRDVQERGRSVNGVLEQYLRFVKPSYDNFVSPTSRFADIIVPGSNNKVAIELITTHVRRKLDERSRRFREKMVSARPTEYLTHASPNDDISSYHLHVLDQTPQLKGILTILRDHSTPREDFIFFVDRLSTFLMEKAMIFLPYRRQSVVTPVGATATGQKLAADTVCGVSILRSGGPLERGLRRVVQDIPIGSLLIHSECKNGEPLLLHVMLPACIRERHLAEQAYVFLLDAQIGTGATAFMAIRVLLDHGVRPDHIIFVTFIVARGGGISVLRRAFPEVHFLCAAVDDTLREVWIDEHDIEEVDENPLKDGFEHDDDGKDDGKKAWVIEPGMGQIGDRYYLG